MDNPPKVRKLQQSEFMKLSLIDQVKYNVAIKRKNKGPRINNKTFELNRHQTKECEESFKSFDHGKKAYFFLLLKDGSGSITEKEWRVAMRSMGFEVSKSGNFSFYNAYSDRSKSNDESRIYVKKSLFFY